MPVIRDLPISLTTDTLAKSIRGFDRRPALAEAATEVVDAIERLAEPAAAYEILPVHGTNETSALVGENVRLDLGPHVDLLSPAQQAFVYAITLGPQVEAYVQQLFASEQIVKGYLLDSAAVAALGLVGQRITRFVERTAADAGWGVGCRLSPGSLVGWPLYDQTKLVKLVRCEEIGISLSNGHMLIPHKSATGLVGLGPAYEAAKVGSVCYLCRLRDTCWRRRS